MPSREDFQSDREAAMKKMAEVNKETLSKIEAKLNDEQQKTWKELLGAPFEIKYEPRPTTETGLVPPARMQSGRPGRSRRPPVRRSSRMRRRMRRSPHPRSHRSRSHIHPGARHA